MRRTATRILPMIAAAMVLIVGAAAPEEEEEFEDVLVPAEERIYLAIGCEGDGATCETTEYWLGREPGDSNVGTTFTVTPVNYLMHAMGESWHFATFFHGMDLADSYVLRTDEPIEGQVSISGFIGDVPLGADSTIRVTLNATDPDNNRIQLGQDEVNKLVATPADNEYPFEIELDESLEQLEVTSLSLDLEVRGLNLLQNGFVNGSGDSWLDLPHHHVVPATDGPEDDEG